MTKTEIAKAFVDRFCSGNIEALEDLLHKNLHFQGPLFTFNSREDYLDSLRTDPPMKNTYKILSITENDDDVSIYYNYGKDTGYLTIAQLFRFKAGRISEIMLVFDTKEFI